MPGQPVVRNGQIEGTGAALNVNVGFKPSVVRLLNIDGDTTLDWCDSMGDATGMKAVAAGTRSHIASGGITAYDGADQGETLQGTATITAGTNTVTGSSTFFTEELAVGNIITIGNQERRVLAIASNTSLTVSEPWQTAASGATAYRNYPSGGGFTIGTDADTNVNGETLHWIAYR